MITPPLFAHSLCQIDKRVSGIWQLNSIVISSDGECCVIDPGYFPRELDELQQVAVTRGSVHHVIFTHGHWDHIAGWQSFSDAQVWASPTLVSDIEQQHPRAMQNLSEAQEFDARWYIERPSSLTWPQKMSALYAGQKIQLGKIHLEGILLPGHSHDSLAIIIREARVLIIGDYLSGCEIPFVEDLSNYTKSLEHINALLSDVDLIIPGHGACMTALEASTMIMQDLDYLAKLQENSSDLQTPGATKIFPRAARVPGMWEEHLKNCKALP